MFHPVLPIRKSASSLARSKSSLERSNSSSKYYEPDNYTRRPQSSVKYAQLNVRCDFMNNTNIDINQNAKIHHVYLSHMSDQNLLTKSKLVDLKKEYYDRRAYNTLIGCNKKNFRKQHSVMNVFSVVTSKRLDTEPLVGGGVGLFEMDDKCFVETQIHPLVKQQQQPVIKTTNSQQLPRVCLDCKRNVDRIAYKKRLQAKTHFYSNETAVVESRSSDEVMTTTTLKTADTKYDIILPVNFFKTMNSMSSVVSDSLKQNSDSLKNQSMMMMTNYDNCEFDFEIKPELNLWHVPPIANQHVK